MPIIPAPRWYRTLPQKERRERERKKEAKKQRKKEKAGSRKTDPRESPGRTVRPNSHCHQGTKTGGYPLHPSSLLPQGFPASASLLRTSHSSCLTVPVVMRPCEICLCSPSGPATFSPLWHRPGPHRFRMCLRHSSHGSSWVPPAFSLLTYSHAPLSSSLKQPPPSRLPVYIIF